MGLLNVVNLFKLGDLALGGVEDSLLETPEIKPLASNIDPLNGVAETAIPIIEQITIDSIFSHVESFISLDISKTSTGWVKYINGVKEEGYYEIQSDPEDLTGQRREFREFIIRLFDNRVYEYVFIEDTIGSVNYKTFRILQQLNPIVDDLMDMGIIPTSPIVREGNSTWKKNLRFASNYKAKIKGEDDKSMIRHALQLLGYGDGTTSFVREDIYDANGLAVGCITRLKLRGEDISPVKLRTTIGTGYKIVQYEDEFEAYDKANSIGSKIYTLDFMNISRDLRYAFKQAVEDLGDDSYIFVIAIPTSKIGNLLLKKKMNLDYEVSYLVVYQTKMHKNKPK